MFPKYVWWLVMSVNAIGAILSISKLLTGHKSKIYSYVGDDYPMRLPLPMDTVETTFDCSARYSVTNSSTSREVWSKSMDTRSGGFVRLGDDYRVFAVSMYHQLHCMAAFQYALANSNGKPAPMDTHIQHCLNYLRQFILCSADDTREPGPLKVADLKDRRGCAPPFSRQCRDWTTLYSYSATNYLDFHEFKVRNGSWTCRNSGGQDSTPKDTPKNLSMMAVGGICAD